MTERYNEALALLGETRKRLDYFEQALARRDRDAALIEGARAVNELGGALREVARTLPGTALAGRAPRRPLPNTRVIHVAHEPAARSPQP